MGMYTDSLREAARRLLKCNGGVLNVPRKNHLDAKELMLLISDMVPSKIELPDVKLSSGVNITYTNDENCNFVIGTEEPDLSYCWVKTDKSSDRSSWDNFRDMVTKLASAGYPGCVGCGGPGAEGPWDEKVARKY